jgi:hypothetical protein
MGDIGKPIRETERPAPVPAPAREPAPAAPLPLPAGPPGDRGRAHEPVEGARA